MKDKTDTIKRAVQGQWLGVYSVLALELSSAIDKLGRHVPCPVHGGSDGFRLFKDAASTGGGVCNTCGPAPDGFALLMWLKGWTFPESLNAVASVLGVETVRPDHVIVASRLPVKKAARRQHNKLKALLCKLWRESLPWSHKDAEPLRRYLIRRGLEDSLPSWTNLRFHPDMQCRDEAGEFIGHFPAMLALLEKAGQPVTLHRTFLTEDGDKAPVAACRMMMPIPADRHPCGAAIRFGQPGRILSVTEGIETALAVNEATGMVTWPLVNTALMGSFEIPDGVEKLIIWADNDKSGAGLNAAEKLAGRAKVLGVEAVIRLPKGPIPDGAKSIDWLDVLNRDGVNGFADDAHGEAA